MFPRLLPQNLCSQSPLPDGFFSVILRGECLDSIVTHVPLDSRRFLADEALKYRIMAARRRVKLLLLLFVVLASRF